MKIITKNTNAIFNNIFNNIRLFNHIVLNIDDFNKNHIHLLLFYLINFWYQIKNMIIL